MVPCVTLSPSGAQAGEMPTDGDLYNAAYNGKVEEVQQLIDARARADVDYHNAVSDGAGTSFAAGSSVGYGV